MKNVITWLFIKPFSVNRVKQERLIREILVLRNDGKNFNWNGKTSCRDWFDQTLNQAEEFANQYKFEKSWGHFLNAETFMVSSIDKRDTVQLNIRAKMILIESEKINSSWRTKQIKSILGSDTENLNSITKDVLLKAMAIKNDYYLTRSHKINLHKVNANVLTFVMILIISGILILSYYWDITNPDTVDGKNFSKGLIISAIFGALGAGFSYGKTLFSYNPESSKIPEQLLSMTVTAFRFIIGASAGVITLLLFKSKFLDGELSDLVLKSPITFIVLSFVAGFSERWVVKIIGLVNKENA